jgi:hypothetical protein
MDHAENTLRAAVKGLTDVVAPAVDPADAQARDQLRLIIAGLDFLLARLNLLSDRERFELDHNLALARALVADGTSGSAAESARLDGAIATGAEVADDSHPAGAALRSASAALAAAVRDFVRRAAHADAATRDRVERRVIAATREWAAVDRAWYLPLGFDPEPDAVAAVDVVLAAPSSHE